MAAATICVVFSISVLGVAGAKVANVKDAQTTAPTTSSLPASGRAKVAITLRDQAGIVAWNRDRAQARIAAGFDVARSGAALGRRTATMQERARQAQVRELNRAASNAASHSQARLTRLIERHGGRVTSALPAPSVVYATLPANALVEVRRSRLVQAIEPAGERDYLGVAEISGADTWHSAGCSGAGAADTTCPTTSAPLAQTGPTNGTAGQGGPDIAVDDQSVNDHHWAFTGGPTPSLGRSPSITTPTCATDTNGADPGRTNGSLHGSTIAAVVAMKQPGRRGAAYGVDKILDPAATCVASNMWLLGLTWFGQPGVTDLPEAWNKSYGIDKSPATHAADETVYDREADMEASQYGIAQAISAGNDGPYATLSQNGAPVRPYNNPGISGYQTRPTHPCVAFNALCVGSVTGSVDNDPSNDVVETFSSRGPTAGGRKKPDIVAHVGSGWGCPNSGYGIYTTDKDTFESGTGWKGYSICGEGTSYSAPFGAGAQLLLSGIGVTSPMVQKAILINSAYPIDSEQDADSAGQEYWTPDAGWGELDLAQAYQDRGKWRLGSVNGAPANNARFFRINGQSVGERTTLTWHRRAIVVSVPLNTLGYTTTDLDLHQLTLAGADNDKDVCGASTTCGVDLSENSDSGVKLVREEAYLGSPTAATGLVPVTGATGPTGVVTKWDATDTATDTVEQVRATTAGDSLIKVSAATTVDGASTEDFALASTEPLLPLSTPTISAPTPNLSDNLTPIGQSVTVQASVTNQSSGADLVDGLDLQSAQATINLPAGVSLVSGAATQSVGTLSTGETENASWTVQSTTSGAHAVTFTAQGQRFGTTFATTAQTATLTADSAAPTVAVTAPSGWQGQRTNPVTWDVSDALSQVTSVEVEASIAGNPYQSVYAGTQVQGSALVTAPEGASVAVRVRATDELANQSAYSTANWQVDGDPPTLTLGGPATVYFGDPATFTAAATNVGTPFTTTYRNSWRDDAPYAPLAGTSITVASVKGAERVQVRVTDELGRVVAAEKVVQSTPRPTSLTFKPQPKGRLVWLRVRVSPAADGYVATTLKCPGKRRKFNVIVQRGRGNARLRKGLGRCTISGEFRPRLTNQFKRSKKRLRARL